MQQRKLSKHWVIPQLIGIRKYEEPSFHDTVTAYLDKKIQEYLYGVDSLVTYLQ